MNFYENFLRLCMSAGKSPSKVAKEVGISKSTVSRWKDGGGITDPTAIKLADYFGVPLSELKGTNTINMDGLLYGVAKAAGMTDVMQLLENRAEDQQKKPTDQMASGLRDAGYYDLTPENKAVIDDLIAKLLKSQSVE